MEELPIEGQWRDRVTTALNQSKLFGALNQEELDQVIGEAQLMQFRDGETMMRQGDPSDSLVLILSGEAVVHIQPEGSPEAVEVGRVGRYDTIGEMGVLLETPRSATVHAGGRVFSLRFNADLFPRFFRQFPTFALATSKMLAERLLQASQDLPLARDGEKHETDSDLMNRLPVSFMQRHRVMPLKTEGDTLILGCVENPTPGVMGGIRQHFPSVKVQCRRIDSKTFDEALRARGTDSSGDNGAEPRQKPKKKPHVGSPRLDEMLIRMVDEGASDLHLTAMLKPRWRIDGEILTIVSENELGEEEVLDDLFKPIMEDRYIEEFETTNDLDFAYELPGTGRFRVNIFRDHQGVGAVMRHIRSNILTLEQLFPKEKGPPTGVPDVYKVLEKLSNYPKGLVLVTGPTGSGKSTTLAAMIDQINKSKRVHILTFEDPIEFVHDSRLALVNQREVGSHTASFTRALKAALREDPDVVLVGEMRDRETVALALETANTGHLVFGTLHTSTAITTVDRIIGLFPADEQEQIRSTLADALRGVVAQTLLKRKGGGRIAALEILVCDAAVSHQIREGQTHQIINAMSTGLKRGNRLLNSSLMDILKAGKITPEEAIAKAIDKDDLQKRLSSSGLAMMR